MKRYNFFKIVVVFMVLFIMLTSWYYKNTHDTAIKNAYIKIDELLLNYQAFRTYVSKVQKEEIYRLQSENIIDVEYFHPEIMSSTFSAKGVNEFYNELREEKGLEPIKIRFASDNPRNPENKATAKESLLLAKFNNHKIKEYSEVIQKDGQDILYYVRPTKTTTSKCMRCHSDPKIAPKGLVEIYGDKRGFYEQKGRIRAILSTSYPLKEDLALANDTFLLFVFITFFIFIILLFIVYRFLKSIDDKKTKLEYLNKTLDEKVLSRTKELEEEKRYIEKIMNINPSIIIISNGNTILDVNDRFLKFFEYATLEDFNKQNNCICDYFDIIDDKIFNKDRIIDGIQWYNYLINSKGGIHTVRISKNDKFYYFNLSAVSLENESILFTFQNITEVKEKETMLIQQSKMASMGEMLTNIAHQWRQPLSMISTSATGISMQQEYGVLTDEKLEKSMEDINHSAQFLSKTIEDFRNFFKQNKEKNDFIVNDMVTQTLKLLEGNFKNNAIEIALDIEPITITALQNELMQVVMNILNNARDILLEKDIDTKLILIQAKSINNNLILSIHDNGGGIPNNIIEKVFEPYFTTKHQSQGTGIGLYMSYEIITKNIGGKLQVSNDILQYKDINELGAKFEIILPVGTK